MFHGSHDNSVPPSFSRKVLTIFRFAKKKLIIVKNGNHSLSSKKNVKAIMLPKVKTPDEITFIDDMLTDCGLDTDLHVIMETNEALESIYDIAHASKRIVGLYF